MGYLLLGILARRPGAAPLGLPFTFWAGVVMFLGVLFFLFGLG